MFSNLERLFGKIGAKVKIVFVESTRARWARRASDRKEPPARLDIITKNKKEIFEIAVREDLGERVEISVLEVLPKERHLVLLAKEFDRNGNTVSRDHFLCGHDERHFFVAAVKAVSTVAEAKASLKPPEIVGREVGLNSKKRNRRRTENYVRQGEWFFVPADITPDPNLIHRNEPLVRGRGSKPHMAQFAYRTGGETVMACTQYPNGVTLAEYKALTESQPRTLNYRWQTFRRNAVVYVKGHVRHPDHATVVLDCWHRVLMNTEARTEAVAFLD